jgi:hypothetical protein
MLLVDSLIRFMGGDGTRPDENAAGDVSQVTGFLVELVQDFPFLTLLYSQHTGHDGKRARGSSEFGAAFDCQMLLKWPGGQNGPGKNVGCGLFNIESPLARNAGYTGAFGVELEVKSHWEETTDGDEVNVIDKARLVPFGRPVTSDDAAAWFTNRKNDLVGDLDPKVVLLVTKALLDDTKGVGLTEYAIWKGKQRIPGVTRKNARAYLRAAHAEEHRADDKSTWHASDKTIFVHDSSSPPAVH